MLAPVNSSERQSITTDSHTAERSFWRGAPRAPRMRGLKLQLVEQGIPDPSGSQVIPEGFGDILLPPSPSSQPGIPPPGGGRALGNAEDRKENPCERGSQFRRGKCGGPVRVPSPDPGWPQRFAPGRGTDLQLWWGGKGRLSRHRSQLRSSHLPGDSGPEGALRKEAFQAGCCLSMTCR